MSQYDLRKPEPKPSGMKTFLRNVVLVFFMALMALAAACILYIWSFLSSPGSLPARDVEVLVWPETSFSTVSRELERQGVVSDARRFVLLAQWKDLTGKLRTGRYKVNTGWTPSQVLEQLVSGSPVLDKVTLPEGLTWWETGKRLEKAGFVKFEDFEKVVHDPDFLRRWGIPLSSAEGFLFPDTYLLMRPLELNVESAKKITGRLIDNFWRRIGDLREAGSKLDGEARKQIAQIVILASIVEKETGLAAERARVAGVYTNRLDKNMLLQADPTTIYGIGPSFDGKLRRSDLNNADNKYNTYQHKGLPPGPIASPGLAAIRAAMNPEKHNFLYFVARGDGGHEFSTDLAAHNRAVRMYLRKDNAN